MKSSKLIYQFGDWSVEPHLNRVSKDEVEHQLEPRTMDVLECLLACAGEVVSTDEILRTVWADRSAEPHMVAKRISQIRRVLDDNVRHPEYIATVSKRGYRTVGHVNLASNGIDDTSEEFISELESQAPPLPACEAQGPCQHKPIDNVSDSTTSNVSKKPSTPETAHRSLALKSTALVCALVVIIAFGWFGSALFRDTGYIARDKVDRAIAVLPLGNISGDPSQQYIADGMTEEITTELSKLQHLHVISRTSVMRYASNPPSLKQIAKDLGVDTIIEGSVAREAGRFRVTIQLIDAKDDRHIWAQSFDRNVSSVLELRSDVARNVAARLNLPSSGWKHVTSKTSREIDEIAYDAYLRGISYVGPSEQYMDWAPKAIGELEKAVKIDPSFAEAWVQLAFIKIIEAVWISRDQFITVREYANRALSIEDNLAVGYTVLGYAQLLEDWDPLGAESLFAKALQLNPNDTRALQGQIINLLVLEHSVESMLLSKKLLRISPLDFFQRSERIRFLYNARLYERVLLEIDSIRALRAEYWDFVEAAAYHRLGRFEDSHKARIAAYQHCGTSSCDQARTAAEQGWTVGGYEGSLRALAQLPSFQENERGSYWIHAQLGEFDTAFALTDNLIKARAPWLVGMRYHPDFDALRIDPRFDSFLARTNVTERIKSVARTADVARLMAFRGHAVEAIEHLSNAMNSSPEDAHYPRWLESMAWAQFALNEYGQAVKSAQQALDHELNPHATAFAHLLICASYAHLDRLDESRAALGEALGAWPGDLHFERDLQPFFLGGNKNMRDRYLAGLRIAGLNN